MSTSVAMLICAAAESAAAKTSRALLSTFAYVFTYVLSVAAYLFRLVRGESTFTGRPLLAQTFGAALALAFSIWMIGETGKDTVFDGVILIFIGIPVYLADQWRRTRRATARAATPTTSDSA